MRPAQCPSIACVSSAQSRQLAALITILPPSDNDVLFPKINISAATINAAARSRNIDGWRSAHGKRTRAIQLRGNTTPLCPGPAPVLSSEEPERFEALFEQLVTCLRLREFVKVMLIWHFAVEAWRLNRAIRHLCHDHQPRRRHHDAAARTPACSRPPTARSCVRSAQPRRANPPKSALRQELAPHRL